jgi:hypothetical protein
MRPGRLLRITVISVALPLAFELSRRVSAASGNEPVPGIEWALGAVSFLFFLRALATEYSSGPEADFQKDLQWGLAAGGVLTILSRLSAL